MSEQAITAEIVDDIKTAWNMAQKAKPFVKTGLVSASKVVEEFEKELIKLNTKWQKRHAENLAKAKK